MKHNSTGNARESLLGLLADCQTVLVGLDRDGRILDLLPAADSLGQGILLAKGQPLEACLEVKPAAPVASQTAYAGGQPEAEPRTQLAYLDAPGTGKSGGRPWLVHRLSGSDQAYAWLFPGCASFWLAQAMPAGLVSEGRRDPEAYYQELQATNRKLRQRSARLRDAMYILEQRNRQIINEMNLAVELQKSLLPKSYPAQDQLSCTHRYIPMAMVGGDFFAIRQLATDQVCVLISDVSGHGVAPAFITAMIRSTFDYLVASTKGPGELISQLNSEFAKIIDTDHYVTAFYAILDFSRQTCRYCNAGHPAQLLVHPDGDYQELLPDNPIIGLMDQYDFVDSEVSLRPGDLLCFFTDGITEAKDEDGVMFGNQGMVRALRSALDGDIETMADQLLTELIQYMKDPYFEDDITIVLTQLLPCL